MRRRIYCFGSNPAAASAPSQVPNILTAASTNDLGWTKRLPNGSLFKARFKMASMTRSLVHGPARISFEGSTPAAITAFDQEPKYRCAARMRWLYRSCNSPGRKGRRRAESVRIVVWILPGGHFSAACARDGAIPAARTAFGHEPNTLAPAAYRPLSTPCSLQRFSGRPVDSRRRISRMIFSCVHFTTTAIPSRRQ
jgi:hypothetical protein